MKIHVVSTCIPGDSKPCFPDVFGTLKEAEAKADEYLRQEWEANGPENTETGEKLPYPGNWRVAQIQIAEWISDGSWGGYEITTHRVEVPGYTAAFAAVSKAIEDWPQWDTDEPVNGGDMVEWFGNWIETAKRAVAMAED